MANVLIKWKCSCIAKKTIPKAKNGVQNEKKVANLYFRQGQYLE